MRKTVIEISKSAYHRNLRFLRKQLGPNVELASVIKANAYGHGIETMVPMAESFGIRHFAVFSADEAQAAWKCNRRGSQITIMGSIDREELDWAIENGISFYVFGMRRLDEAIAEAERQARPARIHLELETGLNRMGLHQSHLNQAVSKIRRHQTAVIVEGVCTHFAGAESIANYVRIQEQLKIFRERCTWLAQQGIPFKRRHCASSAATLTYPETHMDMVRIGIAQYGFWPSEETRIAFYNKTEADRRAPVRDPLKRVMTWKSSVMNLKDVSRGEFVGYGTSYMTTRRQTIASVPVGYYHGFPRSLSNLGRVLVNGKRASVVGAVGMNLMMVDVTDIPGVNQGDEVVIIGRQKRAQISVTSFSDMTSYLNYEVLARLSPNIPRVGVK